jgi:ATP-dependent exoDNAse (exonuclease V) beta subunit
LDFYTRERNDIRAFLEWWEKNKSKKSLQVSGEVDAVQIYSIHKSKGLQFRYVIIPFCSWEIDHAPQKSPTLWVKANAKPFKEETYVPVKYSGILTDTIFSEAYIEEKTRAYLDNLNLLYVAFTRAESGLIIYAPHPEVSKSKNTIATLLYTSITQEQSLKENWNEATGSLQIGELDSLRSESTSVDEKTIALHHYEVSRWRNRMVLRKKSDNVFRVTAIEDSENRKYGLLLHSIFSRIRYAEDLDTVLQQVREEGLTTSKELASIKEQFLKLLNQKQIASWFTTSWEVRTESPILSPVGPDVRVDRVMIKDDHAIVVDYKSGEPRQKDEEQVERYMKILREMNFTKVEGYLLYLATGTVVEVVPSSTKGKENNQLGLGL